MRKIDIFTHIWPKKFHELLLKTTGQMKDMHRRSEAVPMPRACAFILTPSRRSTVNSTAEVSGTPLAMSN